MSRKNGYPPRSWVTYDSLARNYFDRFRSGVGFVSLELNHKDQDANDLFALRVCQELKRLGLPAMVDYVGPGKYHFHIEATEGGAE